MDKHILLIGTRKGAWIYRNDGAGSLSGPHLLGSAVHHAVLDPRDGRTLLLAAKPGHLGHTVYRSTDLGEHWREASRPPDRKSVV